MNTENIDYDALKKRGFLRARQEGFFTLRTRMPAGNYQHNHLERLAQLSRQYGRGLLHITLRQGIEIPFIRFEDIERVEAEIKTSGMQVGTSGPRLRSITSCPGNNWCKRGLINTFSLFDRIENVLGIGCAMNLPHKFKIAISGCPNKCTRAEQSEIGIHGEIDTSLPDKKIGYAVYLGGCGGRTPRRGHKLKKIYTEDGVLSLIERVVSFYKSNAKPRQRFALLIEEIGRESFLKQIGEE